MVTGYGASATVRPSVFSVTVNAPPEPIGTDCERPPTVTVTSSPCGASAPSDRVPAMVALEP